MAAPIRDSQWLSWVTKLLEGSEAHVGEHERTPSDGFRCLLDEQPSHLVPERLLRQLPNPSDGDELFLNPSCSLLPHEPIPGGLRAAAATFPFSASGVSTGAWVQDPATEFWMPFSMSPALEATVRELRHDSGKARTLSSRTRTTLRQAFILVDTEFLHSRRILWSSSSERCRKKFRSDGYAPVSGLIHPFQLAALRSYFRRQIRKGAYPLGDDQSPWRYIAHNDPVAHFFHLQLADAVSELAGERVKPSYVYVASYQRGARLERHIDREQCEFSITMCVDYAPEPKAATPWPLYLDTKEGQATVYQALGDGLLYRGRELPHYRKTLADGNTSTSIFFHYVAENFDGPLE